jgi:hypothetical protein
VSCPAATRGNPARRIMSANGTRIMAGIITSGVLASHP